MASPDRAEQEEIYVLVEYAFEYTSKDGQLISIKPNERYMLLRKTNDHWWHVRKSKRDRPFYIPAKYVRQLGPLTQTISSPDKLAPTALLDNASSEAPVWVGGEPSPEYEYRFVNAIREHEVDSCPEQQPVSSGAETVVRSDASKKTLPSISGAGRATLSASHGSLKPPYDAGSPCSLVRGNRSTEHMRPTVSLDDLARLTPQSQANIENLGLYKAASWGPPRPLLKSNLETFHKPVEEKVDEGTKEYNPTQMMAGFEKLGFPFCLGAVDGTHVPVSVPKLEGQQYYNRKSFHSVLLQAACDSECVFFSISLGFTGVSHDAHVFRCSRLYRRLLEGTLVEGNPTSVIDGVRISPLLLGDGAYPLSRFLMKAYPIPRNDVERHFNYVLNHSRNCVERAFGILKSRFRRLSVRLDVQTQNINSVIAAAVVLHNICQRKKHFVENMEHDDELPNVHESTTLTYSQPTDCDDNQGMLERTEGEKIRDTIARFIYRRRRDI